MHNHSKVLQRLNTLVPAELDDRVFFYAQSIEFSPSRGWNIFMDLDHCLTGFSNLENSYPTVDALRRGAFESQMLDDGGFRLSGRLLFSAGVLLFVEDSLVLFKRGSDASISPDKWTCAAGRADRHPYLTALKELNEEVIVYDKESGLPIFLQVPNESFLQEVERTFEETLSRKNFSNGIVQCLKIPANPCAEALPYSSPVGIWWGDECVDFHGNDQISYFSFFNPSSSTLELMLPLRISHQDIQNIDLAFTDGEYERPVRMFTPDEFNAMEESSLVTTMKHLKTQLRPTEFESVYKTYNGEEVDQSFYQQTGLNNFDVLQKAGKVKNS